MGAYSPSIRFFSRLFFANVRFVFSLEVLRLFVS
jgi:hypothetical protein